MSTDLKNNARQSGGMGQPVAAACLAGIVIIGIVFRALGLGAVMMFDEAASWDFARLPWDTFWEVMWRFEGNSVAYYLLLGGWLHLGDDVTVMRSLSALFGVATVVLVYFLGSRLFSRRAGLIASLLLAVHSFHVSYSQLARGYAMTTMLLAASMLLFVTSQQRRSRALDAGYVLVSALACYGHLLSVLVLGAQWLWFVATNGCGALRSRIGTLAALALTSLPTAWYAVAMNGGQIDWIKPLDRWRFLKQVTSLVGGDYYNLGIYALLGAISVGYAVLSRQQPMRRHTGLVFAWLALPVATLVAISPVKSMFIDRYLLMCLPALVLLAGAAVDRLLDSGRASQAIGVLIGMLAVGVTANASIGQYRRGIDEPNALKEMTAYVIGRQKPDDAVILFTAATYFPYHYYAAKHEPPVDVVTSVVFPDFGGGVPSGLQPNPTPDEVRHAIAGRDRVWLLLNKSSIRLVPGAAAAEPELHRVLQETHALAHDHTIGFMQICLYERRTGAQEPPLTVRADFGIRSRASRHAP